MVQLLPWQWALIALAIVVFISLAGLGIYLFWRKQNKQPSTTKPETFDRPQIIIERSIQEDGEEQKRRSRDSAIKRLSPRFPSSLIIQQQQLYNQPNSGSVMMMSDSNITIDIEKAQHHLVMMPLSAPPPRTRRTKPKLICAKEQSQLKNAKDNNIITIGGSNNNTNSSNAVHRESSSSSPSLPSLPTTSPPLPFLSANAEITVTKKELVDEKNPSNMKAIDDDHDHEKHKNQDENSMVVPMTMTTPIDSGTPSSTLAMAKGPFVLTPFIGSPTTTPTSTSGRSTGERIIVNSVHESLRSNNSNNSGTMIEQPHQQQQRYSSSTTSLSNYVLASSTVIDRPSSSCNHSNRSSSGSRSGGSPSDHQLQQLPYTIKPLSTNSNTSWRGPTPPWTLLRDNSTIDSNNKLNT
ncbi:hypothetical protein INT45_007471 [Circinella minor]|uniref:Uncharacterized protein n=1 Tax=Circinella minor TaxID=1195481 RepID=A0A8H7SFU0_9FUNG|nr:hypothetical protein INT45_007471 [Circinella minor]